ncbi:hypothetical protein [Mucilaginibacter pedocola]|uniref:hypothetical protein n=1 Tax=Mucilaginibacter pedocola TaxID=1792845 RepID=UPI00192E62CE|nr:hypothetical protein [Mucilaginibacter pedocola]
MMELLGLPEKLVPGVGAYTILAGLFLLIPQTYFLGNLLNAVSIVIIMCLAARAGNLKMALIEIPFLALPIVLIWLKYPLKFK